MSIRELPNFLRNGDKTLRMPRREGFRHVIGTAQLDESPVGAASGNDPASAGEQAVREWLAHVAAGRIGVGK